MRLWERGVVSLDAFAQKVDRFTRDLPNHRFIAYGENAELHMIKEFMSFVTEDRTSDTLASPQDGMHALYVAHAAYESARSGWPVRTRFSVNRATSNSGQT